ncbi:HNH endonuclease [Flavivirga jejuensis]|uniref:HNH endonuclease domain-containing protein n=1 Tax=Flavivirga jejuensis TaxID=870487 RepID=A0ABT8WUT1_9FLAO|nr:HNH endonuclease domain-containing protein [Flavivirga jejuensis]MDO5976844.1 HNH endonuclease domain-containing protein [Flavivirga jejuensis]
MAKYKYHERYAVWLNHEKRCWLCKEPLRIDETTIDHILPESLLDDEKKKKKVFEIYGLNDKFRINGFENWLPAHLVCNQNKGSSILNCVPLYAFILNRTIKKAEKVLRTSQAMQIKINSYQKLQ